MNRLLCILFGHPKAHRSWEGEFTCDRCKAVLSPDDVERWRKR